MKPYRYPDAARAYRPNDDSSLLKFLEDESTGERSLEVVEVRLALLEGQPESMHGKESCSDELSLDEELP